MRWLPCVDSLHASDDPHAANNTRSGTVSSASASETDGLNLLIYPSELLSSGRLSKIARSLQNSGSFKETHIVGINSGNAAQSVPAGEGIRVSRVKGASLRSRFGGIRIMLFWPFRVFRRYRKEKISAVAAQNVYLLPLAYHLARRTGAVFAYNAHELETETIGAHGMKQKIAQFLERRYIYRADIVSVVNESIAAWYSEKYEGVAPVVLTNTPVDAGGTVSLRSELGIPEDELLYIHVGFLMEGRSIPFLIKTFADSPRAHLAFLGDGYLRSTVDLAAAAHPNIHVLPTVAPEAVVSVVRGADIGICLIEPVSLSDRLSTPNKLMESLAAGIPPLTSDLVEAKRILGPELTQTWVLEKPSEQFADAVKRIGQADIDAFRDQWHGMPSWDDQAVGLVDAYKTALRKRDILKS